jgi:hypothetical protein
VQKTIAAAILASGALIAALASAQRIEPRRPRTLVVGAPAGPAPMERVDAKRSGLAGAPLPSGTLRVAWRRSLGLTMEHAPLVDGSGDVTLVTSRGDVVVLDADGNERTHTAVGSSAVGAAARLADGTIAFVTGAAEVVGVKLGVVRFRARMGGERAAAGAKLAPLALDDGGFVAASATEVHVFDAEGNVRARAAFGEPLGGPLVAAMGRVIVTTQAGVVYAWAPGRDPSRIASFGGTIDGGAALEGDHTLLAVIDGAQLAELDLQRGVVTSRASAVASGVAAFAGPPAVRGTMTTLLALTATRTFIVTLDASGQEVARQGIGTTLAANATDGGAGAIAPPPHVGVLVDPRGAVAFASPDGQVGSISATGGLDVLGEPLCARLGPASGATLPSMRAPGVFGGLAPAGPFAMVVACESGIVAKIVSDGSATESNAVDTGDTAAASPRDAGARARGERATDAL